MKKVFLCALCLVVACGACLLTGCRGNHQKSTASAAAAASDVLEIDDLLLGADSLVGRTVTIEGICTHTCKHGARKIFLMGSDDTQTIRVESGELGSFDPQCVNRIVRVTGRVDEERIDEAYLANWEAQVKAQTAEKHGTTEAGCSTEKAARQETGNTVGERIADFRARIAARRAAHGTESLALSSVPASPCDIQ